MGHLLVMRNLAGDGSQQSATLWQHVFGTSGSCELQGLTGRVWKPWSCV